tara:strand:- start:763 stop:1365 length:603 start_codon:yes stop_codon:yes gene_type:complete
MVEKFLEGGAWMWPILFIFIIGFVFVIERIYFLMKGLKSSKENFINDAMDTYKSKGADHAKELCESASGPVANLLHSGFNKAKDGRDEAEKSMDLTASVEMSSLENNMTWISLCIATAPMLGFLGTVVGMIAAFKEIKLQDDISPAVVAGGIEVALLTTAFGLIVAVILQVLQNIVLYIIDNQIVTMQKSSAQALEIIKK